MSISIRRVEGGERWFEIRAATGSPPHLTLQVAFAAIYSSKTKQLQRVATRELDFVSCVRLFYDMKIGEIGCYWNRQWKKNVFRGVHSTFIEYSYATIKLGDVFDFYTDKDGVLRVPEWTSFKYAVDQYLAEDPKMKFHPSRVQAFIDEHGVEQLEEMT